MRRADGVIGAIIDGHDQVMAAVRAAEPRIAELVEAAADRTRGCVTLTANRLLG